MTASKTKATKAKAFAAKASAKATVAPIDPTPVSPLPLEPVEPAEVQFKASPGREPKRLNSTQAAAMLAGGVIVGRAMGWL
jgi:hypothetical protein